jgi:hypothetical protein
MGGMGTNSSSHGFDAAKVRDLVQRDEPPVWTASALADELGVSRVTINNNSEEIESLPEVETTQLAQATVYYSKTATPDTYRLTPNLKGAVASSPEVLAAGAVSRWRFASHRAHAVRNSDPIRGRGWLHQQLVDLVEEFNVSVPQIHLKLISETDGSETEWTPGDEDSESRLPLNTVPELIGTDSFELDDEEIIRYLRTEPLYASSDVGPIDGFGSLIGDPVATPLADEHGRIDFEEADSSELDRVLPSYGDLYSAGQLWLTFLSELYDWRWR